jgi:penicillin-binding protein 1A
LQVALAQSINTVAARLADEVGRNNVAATAHRLGIVTPIQTGPSMALGAVEVTPIEMAQAYSAFSNGGYLTHAYGIERIRTASGKVLYDHSVSPAPRAQVIAEPALGEMVEMMRQVVASGTGTRAAVGGYDIAGKTGTTSDFRDAWFVGYTGGLTTAVWTGRDDNTPMHGVTGGMIPAEIWHAYMAATLPRMNVQTIPGGPAAPQPGSDQIGDILSGLPPEETLPPPPDGRPAVSDAPPPPPPG